MARRVLRIILRNQKKTRDTLMWKEILFKNYFSKPRLRINIFHLDSQQGGDTSKNLMFRRVIAPLIMRPPLAHRLGRSGTVRSSRQAGMVPTVILFLFVT